MVKLMRMECPPPTDSDAMWSVQVEGMIQHAMTVVESLAMRTGSIVLQERIREEMRKSNIRGRQDSNLRT